MVGSISEAGGFEKGRKRARRSARDSGFGCAFMVSVEPGAALLYLISSRWFPPPYSVAYTLFLI